MEYGMFCQVYGKNLRNVVLELILERESLDFAISDLLDELSISKPKMYELIKELENNTIIKKSRVIGKTQLFVLHEESNIVKLLKKSFSACLKLEKTTEEHSQKIVVET